MVTARHVVYNAEEANKTRVDLFYDEENSRKDGKMKSVWAVDVEWSNPEWDVCNISCVTHDEAVARRITSLNKSWLSLLESYQYSLIIPKMIGLFGRSKNKRRQAHPGHAVIVSHPHGQPKKITVGDLGQFNGHQVKYDAATCPGSSGAAVLPLYTYPPSPKRYPWRLVHGGSCSNKSSILRHQTNYGNDWM